MLTEGGDNMDIFEWLSSRGIHVENRDLILQAFTHSSYANEHKNTTDNERLEFMGDAVLQLWSSKAIYPLNLSEGRMTTLRQQLVCEKALAEYAREMDLARFLRLGQGEEKSGGRDRDAIIADMFEALLGALYLDQGKEAVDNILNEVITPRLTDPEKAESFHDYKSVLQELVQSDIRQTVRYELVSMSGPSNAPSFVMNAVIDGVIMGTGEAGSKKQAEQNAAKDALNKIAR